jgi:UDP-2-acetamido-2,6-beta-L-arabino-hexul-4-ose reductase
VKILVTGTNGFLARNLLLRLRSSDQFLVETWSSADGATKLKGALKNNQIIFHLASAIRSETQGHITEQNEWLVDEIHRELANARDKKKLIFASTSKLDGTEYALSKQYAEKKFTELSKHPKVTCTCIRLPSIFGKFSRPNHNSVVSTFCYNAINNIELNIHKDAQKLRLIYVDDVIDIFINHIKNTSNSIVYEVKPTYEIQLEELKEKIIHFASISNSDPLPNLGNEFDKRLFSTFKWFEGSIKNSKLTTHVDERGLFAELIKLDGSGQVSFFTIEVGHARGGHYHDTKWERFFIIDGVVKFLFEDLTTGERYDIECAARDCGITTIDSVPGVVHTIENIGKCRAKLVVWANEIFDQKNPDTYMVAKS